MAEVNLNPNVQLDPLQQANLLNVLETLEQTPELPPLLNGNSNLTITSPADLDSLLAKLNLETANSQETAARTAISSTFTTVLARTMESGNITAQNMEILNQAKEYSTQLDALKQQIQQLNEEIQALQGESATAQTAVAAKQQQVNQLTLQLQGLQQQQTQAQQNVEVLQAKVDSLNSLIDAETDPVQKAALEMQLTEAETDLADAQNALATAQQNVGNAQTQLSQATAELQSAQATLSAKQTALAEKVQARTALDAQQATLEQNIADKLSELSDAELARNLAEALRAELPNVQNLLDEKKAERSEEEEKYLDEHQPLRIIQNAIANHDQEILDTISTKREEKV